MQADTGGPAYDRVRLTAEERRVIADLEQALAQEQPAGGRLSRQLAGLAGAAYRAAYWLAPICALATVLAINSSPIAGAVTALVTAVMVAMSLWRALGRRLRRREEDASRRRRPG